MREDKLLAGVPGKDVLFLGVRVIMTSNNDNKNTSRDNLTTYHSNENTNSNDNNHSSHSINQKYLFEYS